MLRRQRNVAPSNPIRNCGVVDLEDVNTLVQEIRLLVASTPSMTGRPGSVVSARPGEETVTVKMDGDPSTVTNEVTNMSGVALSPGARVLVVFIPPNGGYILGAPATVVPIARVYLRTGDDS